MICFDLFTLDTIRRHTVHNITETPEIMQPDVKTVIRMTVKHKTQLVDARESVMSTNVPKQEIQTLT